MADVARELLVKLGIQFDDKSAQKAEQKVEQLKHAAEGLARSFKKLDRGGNLKAVGNDFLAKKALGIADVNPSSFKKLQSADPMAVMAKSMEYAQKPAEGLISRIMTLKNGLLALAGALAVRKIASFIQHTADAADELKAQAERIGTTTQALQGLQYAAQQSDTSAEALGSGLQFLARSAYAAANGSKEAAEAFSKLGVKSLKDANGKLKTTDQLMLEIADGLEDIASPAEKTALVMKVMGKSAGELVPFLSKGSAEILAFRKELDDLGGLFSTEFVDVADEWNDQGTRMGAVLKGIGAAMGKGILPPLTRMSLRFFESWKIFGGITRSGIEKFFAGLGNIIETVAAVLESFLVPTIAFVASLVDWFGNLDSGLQILIVTLGAVALVMAGIMAPWALIAAVIGLVVEDIYTYFVGGDSVTGQVVESFKMMGQVISDFFGSVFDGIVEKFNYVGGLLKGFLNTASNFLGGDISQTLTAEGASIAPSGQGASVVNAPTTTNTITVTASPGMDEEALADKVMRKLDEHESERNREAFGALVPAAQ